jgi:hypothetical protein
VDVVDGEELVDVGKVELEVEVLGADDVAAEVGGIVRGGESAEMMMTGLRNVGRVGTTGIADSAVVFLAGSYISFGMISRLNG